VKRTFDNPVMIGVGLIVALLVIIASLNYRNTRQLNEDARWVAHTHEVLNLASDVMLTLVDAETGTRGFVVTGKDEFLQPYDHALARFDGLMAKLKDAAKDSSGQRARITKLEEMTAVRLGHMKEVIGLRRKDENAAEAFIQTGKPKVQMDAIRQQVAGMLKVEDDLLKERERKTATTYQAAVTTGLITTFLGLVTVGAFVWLLNRSLRTRQQAAAVIAEQGERLRTTLASIGDAVITTDMAGRITNMNAEAESLTAWTNAEAMGQLLDAVFRIVNETTRKTVLNPATRAMKEGIIVGLANHTVLIAKDGTERPIDDSAAPIRCKDGEIVGCVLVFRDITERKQAEQQRFDAVARTESVLNNVVNGVITIDERGVVETFNSAAERLFGYKDEEIVGQNVKILMGEPYHSEHDGYLANYMRTGQAKVIGIGREVEARRKDGSAFLMDLGVSEFLLGERRYFTAIVRDITERKRLEEQLREVAAALSDAGRRKDEFLATLAHELRNPLAPIRNGLLLMKLAGDNAEAVERSRSMMERQIEQMVRLVDDLMDISRISQGKLELLKEHVPLGAVIASAVETTRPLIEQMGHELTVTLPKQPLIVDADMTRLAQVFMNLLSNSAKYSERGGHIWLTVERQGSDVVVSVRDTGIGIPTDKLTSVFDMFSQVDRSLEKSQGGLGIGLSLVKRLVEIHGGRIEAKSDGPGRGSEFVVRLPVDVEASRPQAADKQQEPAAPKSSLRILIVDDSKDGADSLAMVLKMMGNDTRTAYDGKEGVELAEEFRPEVVLFDIGMPKLNGYEACRLIRKQPWGRKVIVIAVTGWGQEDDRQRSHDAGFDHHMVKPVDPQALMKMLAGLDVGHEYQQTKRCP